MKNAVIFIFLLLLAGIGGFAQVGINASNMPPDASAGLDVNFSNKGVLLPRMTHAQRNAIQSPAEGLIVMCTDCSSGGGVEITYFSAGSWYVIPKVPEWQCGFSMTVYHVTERNVAPVDKTTTYGTVNNIPGEPSKCWITSNLGSDHQATAVSDATEPSAGWYWQFNRKQGFKHNGATRIPATTWITSINEDSDWIGVNDPCTLELGSGWRLPTNSEWTNVDASGSWASSTQAWGSELKLHAAGYLDGTTGILSGRGSSGSFWSGTQYGTQKGWNLLFQSGSCAVYYLGKEQASPIRCIRE